jgi:hypothetical protein
MTTRIESQSINDLQKTMQEILKWIRLQGMQTAKTILEESLKKDAEKLAYHFSDGRDSREVGKLAGISHMTVTNYWKKWSVLGIVEPVRARGGDRYRKIFSLEDFGIGVPRETRGQSKRTL